MSRRLKFCWVCDKCGDVWLDKYSTSFAKQLPPGWMFMSDKGYSNSCICKECRNDIVRKAK